MANMDCKNCKYDYDRWCATDKFCYGIDCKDCKLNDKELNVCKCYIIAPHQDCPYYEPIEEEVDE